MFSSLSLLTVSMVTLVTAMPISASATTGDARNGADFSGEAIPIHVDRAITQKAAEAAISKCTVDLLSEFAEQVFPGTSSSDIRVQKSGVVRYEACRSVNSPNSDGRVCASPTDLELVIANKGLIGFYDGFVYGRINETWNYFRLASRVTRQWNMLVPDYVVLPQLSFERKVFEPKYDRVGNQLPEDSILKNPYLVPGSSGREPQQLFNISTGVGPVGMLNIEKYLNCLEHEIQSR
jgi:hypothetical protein